MNFFNIADPWRITIFSRRIELSIELIFITRNENNSIVEVVRIQLG